MALFIAVIVLFVTVGNQTTTNDVDQQRANTNIDAGLSELLTRGVSSYQIDSLKNGLYRFARQENEDIVKMTMNIDSVDRIVENSGEVSEDYVIFTIKLGGKQYSVRSNLPGMSSAQVLVSEAGKQVFDSGVIDLAAEGIDT